MTRLILLLLVASCSSYEPTYVEADLPVLSRVLVTAELESIHEYNITCGYYSSGLADLRFVDLHKKPNLVWAGKWRHSYCDYLHRLDEIVLICRRPMTVSINGHPWLYYDEVWIYDGGYEEGKLYLYMDGGRLFHCNYNFKNVEVTIVPLEKPTLHTQ